jgi:hypothetical protein
LPSYDGAKHVILYAALEPGSLTLVEWNDGSYRVLHDDRPVPGCRWEPHQVEAAVKRFRQLTAQLKGGTN